MTARQNATSVGISTSTSQCGRCSARPIQLLPPTGLSTGWLTARRSGGANVVIFTRSILIEASLEADNHAICMSLLYFSSGKCLNIPPRATRV